MLVGLGSTAAAYGAGMSMELVDYVTKLFATGNMNDAEWEQTVNEMQEYFREEAEPTPTPAPTPFTDDERTWLDAFQQEFPHIHSDHISPEMLHNYGKRLFRKQKAEREKVTVKSKPIDDLVGLREYFEKTHKLSPSEFKEMDREIRRFISQSYFKKSTPGFLYDKISESFVTNKSVRHPESQAKEYAQAERRYVRLAM